MDDRGYLLTGADGGVFAFGDNPYCGSMTGTRLDGPIVGIGATDHGYYLAGTDGGIFAFGDAQFHESATGDLENVHAVGVVALNLRESPSIPLLGSRGHDEQGGALGSELGRFDRVPALLRIRWGAAGAVNRPARQGGFRSRFALPVTDDGDAKREGRSPPVLPRRLLFQTPNGT